MIYVGIDIAKDKHDYCILGEGGKTLLEPRTIKNTRLGFKELVNSIRQYEDENRDGDGDSDKDNNKVRIGLEDTGDYGDNLISYLQKSHYTVCTINPLLTANNKKANSLRKTKTDSIDAKQIATMLLSGIGFKPKAILTQEDNDLKHYVRYRDSLVKRRSKEKTSVKRLVNSLFPELVKCSMSIHSNTMYALLTNYSSAEDILKANEDEMTKIIVSNSRGRHGKETAIKLKELASSTIGTYSKAKAYELTKTIERINGLSEEIKELEEIIEDLVKRTQHKFTTIPGIGKISAAMIIAEVGDFSRFDNPNKLLAFAGMAPTTYQSGKYISNRAKMEKRGSTLLRQGLFFAAMGVCRVEPTFALYLRKKLNEGKHYYVAISSVVRKLVRLIFAMEKSGSSYDPAKLLYEGLTYNR